MGELFSRSLDDLEQVAERIIEIAKDVKVVAFSGDLGAGKTTLISRILKKLSQNNNKSKYKQSPYKYCSWYARWQSTSVKRQRLTGYKWLWQR